MKIEDRRETCLELLCDTSSTINLIMCKRVSPIQLDDDIEDITAFLSEYISKHRTNFITLDRITFSIQKSQIVTDLSNYLSKVDPDHLEALGALLCKVFEYDEVFTTKKTHDQGIDIIGIKKFKFFDTKRKSFIIGQSKNYAKELVDVRDVRELAGAILLLRHQEFSQNLIAYPTIKISSFSSITAIFVTSYYFSEPARKLCDTSGIIPFDFIDLVCVFANAALDGKIDVLTLNQFDSVKFDNLINSIKPLA